jgi:hypothetical protein
MIVGGNLYSGDHLVAFLRELDQEATVLVFGLVAPSEIRKRRNARGLDGDVGY